MAENAVITKELILGQAGTEQGVIRSESTTAFDSGPAGFYLTNAGGGTLRIGNPSGNKLV